MVRQGARLVVRLVTAGPPGSPTLETPACWTALESVKASAVVDAVAAEKGDVPGWSWRNAERDSLGRNTAFVNLESAGTIRAGTDLNPFVRRARRFLATSAAIVLSRFS